MASTDSSSESLAAEEARRLYEEGLSVIPLGAPGERPPAWFVKDRCDGNEAEARDKWPKTPRIAWKEYQSRQPTDVELEAWIRNWPTCNWALLTGPVVVVDADSAEAVAFLESGKITRSPRKVTTAKGAHFYFRENPRLPIRNSANPNSKIDMRGHGGYVVAPGSVHHTGVLYTEETLAGWGDTSYTELPMLTADDLQAIAAFNGLKMGYNGALSFDGPGNLSFDATKVKPAADGAPVAEGGRNNAAASLAGQLINAGTDARSIMAQLRSWNSGNSPPLPAAELERTVTSVIQTHLRNHPEQSIPFEPPAPHVPTRLEAFNAGDFEGLAPEPIAWLWDHWIARRMTIGVFAEGGTGKSLFVLQMAVCMASGRPFVDGSTLTYGKSLLVFCEDELPVVNLRLRRILSEQDLTFADIRDHIYIICRVGDNSCLMSFDRNGKGTLTPFWADLDATIAQLEPQLLVIDTALDAFGGNPIDNQQVREFIQRGLTSLATKHDLAACFLSHVSVGGKASGSGISGATAWRDRARVQIYMNRESPDDPRIQVTRMKANHASVGETFTIYNAAGYLQGKAYIDLSDQVDDLARMDFMLLLERFTNQGTSVSPARNSPHYAPKIMTRYAKTNRKTVRTKDPAKYEAALYQLLESGQVTIVTDPRKGTKTVEIPKE